MSIYSFKVKSIDGQEKSLEDYRGKAMLIVNVASKCGFTPQYQGLEKLYQKFKDQGFVILGFPCNQFGGQEPGSEHEIKEFCSVNYGVSFPIFEKIKVNGPGSHALYEFLKKEAKGIMGTEAIKWNFTKFLVDQNGKVLERLAPAVTPEKIEPKIKKLLQKAA